LKTSGEKMLGKERAGQPKKKFRKRESMTRTVRFTKKKNL
jgi:hypothetical protein